MLREETNGAAAEAVSASGRLHLEPRDADGAAGASERHRPPWPAGSVRRCLTAGGHLWEALNKAAPHGRDYYPLGDAALARAQGRA